MAKSTALVKESEWEWTDEREQCFQMKLRGFPNTQIANDLEVHRNTINAWVKHPSFAKRLEDELTAFARDSRLRRMRATTTFTDRISNLAAKTLKDAEKNPKSGRALQRARAWLGEFRSMRNEERLNYGDSTENHSINGMVQHSGQVATMSAMSFKQFLQHGVETGVIDAKLVSQAGNKKAALVEAVQQALVDGELIRALDQESSGADPSRSTVDAEYTESDTADESEEGQQGPETGESP